MASSQSGVLPTKPLSFSQANIEEEKKQFDEARKNQAAWILGSATLRLTKLCAPRCLDLEKVQVGAQEK